jgi:hypothetical protein
MKGEKILKKSLGAVSVLSIVSLGFLGLEPMSAQAVSDSVDVSQVVTSEISISSPADVSLSPSIAGMTGGAGTGSATWTVKTNNTAGFNLTIKASAAPALVSGANTFADYTESTRWGAGLSPGPLPPPTPNSVIRSNLQLLLMRTRIF